MKFVSDFFTFYCITCLLYCVVVNFYSKTFYKNIYYALSSFNLILIPVFFYFKIFKFLFFILFFEKFFESYLVKNTYTKVVNFVMLFSSIFCLIFDKTVDKNEIILYICCILFSFYKTRNNFKNIFKKRRNVKIH